MSPQMTIAADASQKGWGAFCRGRGTGGPWSSQEKKFHINILELKAIQIAILTFSKWFPEVKAIHIQTDNIVALSYLIKMGGTKNQDLTLLSKEIWEYLMREGITITAEHLPGKLNIEADTQSRSVRDSSEWKLCPVLFKRICLRRGTPSIDLFASRLSHQVPRYMSWKMDPFGLGKDAFQIDWQFQEAYAFPPFCLIPRVLKKVLVEKATILLITPAWQTQAWYPSILQMSVQNPLSIPKTRNLLLDPDQKVHPLVKNQSLQLVAWNVSGKNWLQKGFQKTLSLSSQMPGEKVQTLITTRLGESLIAGVVNGMLIPFDVL